MFEPEIVADYLLYRLNLRLAAEAEITPDEFQRESNTSGRELMIDECYTKRVPLPADFQRTDSLAEFLDSLAFRLGALRKGGERDIDTALTFLLKHFREGKLGRWTLDDVDGVEAAYLARHAPQTAPSDIVVSELGAVGTKKEVVESGSPVSSGTDAAPLEAPLPPTLEERIALQVSAFLARTEEEKADADAGRNISPTQQKKADMRAKVEYRLAKVKAKGLDKPGGGRPVKAFGYKDIKPKSGRGPSGPKRRK